MAIAKPYVGITGLTTEQEMDAVVEEFAHGGHEISPHHDLMLGFLVSHKTLNGQSIDNSRYPKFSDLPSLLKKAKNNSASMIHYTSSEANTLASQLAKMFNGIYSENLCKAVQLNIVYPDIRQVSLAKESMPNLKIVFQASGSMMREKATKELARRISQYGSAIDYVLIDPSGGSGKGFDLENSLNLYEELSCVIPDARIGFAGGLTGENVYDRIRELRLGTGTTGFCIDAEGGLRDKLSEKYGDDKLNIEKVRAYLGNSIDGFSWLPDSD